MLSIRHTYSSQHYRDDSMKSPVCILWIRHPSLTNDAWEEVKSAVGGYSLLPDCKASHRMGYEALILPKGTHPTNIETTND